MASTKQSKTVQLSCTKHYSMNTLVNDPYYTILAELGLIITYSASSLT